MLIEDYAEIEIGCGQEGCKEWLLPAVKHDLTHPESYPIYICMLELPRQDLQLVRNDWTPLAYKHFALMIT